MSAILFQMRKKAPCPIISPPRDAHKKVWKISSPSRRMGSSVYQSNLVICYSYTEHTHTHRQGAPVSFFPSTPNPSCLGQFYSSPPPSFPSPASRQIFLPLALVPLAPFSPSIVSILYTLASLLTPFLNPLDSHPRLALEEATRELVYAIPVLGGKKKRTEQNSGWKRRADYDSFSPSARSGNEKSKNPADKRFLFLRRWRTMGANNKKRWDLKILLIFSLSLSFLDLLVVMIHL